MKFLGCILQLTNTERKKERKKEWKTFNNKSNKILKIQLKLISWLHFLFCFKWKSEMIKCGAWFQERTNTEIALENDFNKIVENISFLLKQINLFDKPWNTGLLYSMKKHINIKKIILKKIFDLTIIIFFQSLIFDLATQTLSFRKLVIKN